MSDERETNEKLKLLENGIGFCSTYIESLPINHLEKDALYKKCLSNWLAMPPEKRTEIQTSCAVKEDSEKCPGFKILNPTINPSFLSNVKGVATCQTGALHAPDDVTTEEFKQWCFARIPTPQKIQGIEPGSFQPVGWLAPEAIRVGYIELPFRILDKMSKVLVEVEYKDFPAREVPTSSSLSNIPLSKRVMMFQNPNATKLKLPLEKGFLILVDSNGNLKTSKIISGEPCYTEPIACIHKAHDEGFTVIGVFHIHPHPSHSSIPGAEDFETARHLQETVCPHLNLLAVGGFMRNRPVIHIFLKRDGYSWADFTKSPLIYLFNHLFPDPTRKFFIKLENGEIERFNIYEVDSHFATDIVKKMLCSKQFFITTVDAETGRMIDDVSDPPTEVFATLKELMLDHLTPLPPVTRRRIKQAIARFIPKMHPAELLDLFYNDFLEYYEGCCLHLPSHYRFNTGRPRLYSSMLKRARITYNPRFSQSERSG